MQTMKTIASVFLFFLMASPALSQTKVTIYADNNYPPYAYAEGGEVKGIYTEILRTAFSRMKDYQVTIEAVPWARGLNYVETGTGLALYPPYYHPASRPWIKPYSVPILEENVVAMCTEKVLSRPRTAWPADYHGLTFGINAGFKLGGEAFWNAVDQGHIRVEEAQGSRANLLKLGAERIDCYINDRISILWEVDRLRRSGEYRWASPVEGYVISSEQGYLGFTDRDEGRFPFKNDFVKKFNTEIEKMRASGEIQKIIDRFVSQ
ncbi:ABC transporter substrate-binding protein [Desulfobotulus sp. H1]|uniref:ABC transporter substrate-binding protein n=1 Tax=Desulfobotulus pelophilus TaxID=2823377 RepID=A0ABT3N6M7_9BACT|nr:ABC transporter substrate-binding protein [Desulfobotulus pelophilus]MCW7753089.1 ABC transporter substrate-binding protein [Desulfobotulus pelophilus]